MKRMLFNVTQQEESRVAIVDDQKLINLDIEVFGREQRKGNIYKGIITKVEPSLEACFVDYGVTRHGFLPFKEIHRSYYHNYEGGYTKIHEGISVLVQVDKDERGNKGAALTTYISLAGRYLVVMPNNPRGGGISRRIEGEDRADMKYLISQLNISKGTSVIARTAGIGRSIEELQWDLDYQLKLWDAVLQASQRENVQSLILQESALVIRAIRDYFQPDVDEIVVDSQEIYDKICQFISLVMPESLAKVKLYQDHIPLFSRFQIENQIDTVYARQVLLPSGGEVVIDHTEALVSIDVNSAKATRGANVEDTALQNNLEAAEEITKQIRLRDIGGLIVIDFIDMADPKHQCAVETAMSNFFKNDRARVQTTGLSRFGLMEISRQRLHISLEESTHIICPSCCGTGSIRGIQSLAIHVLRVIQDIVTKEHIGEIQAQVPVDVATFLLNEKKDQISSLEGYWDVLVFIIPNKYLEIPHYSVERIKRGDVVTGRPSYSIVQEPQKNTYESNAYKIKELGHMQAAVHDIQPSNSAPQDANTKKSLLAGLINWASRLFLSDKQTNHRTKNNLSNDKFSNNHQYRLAKNSNSINNYDRDKNSNLTTQDEGTSNITEPMRTINRNDNNCDKHAHQHHPRKNSQEGSLAKVSRGARTKGSPPKNKQNANHNNQVSRKLKVPNQLVGLTKEQSLVVDVSQVDEVDATNIKHNKNSGRKTHRYRISAASYLENRINVDRISRHVKRVSNHVLKDSELSLLDTKNTSSQGNHDTVLEIKSANATIGTHKNSNIMVSFPAPEQKTSHSASNLILVETNQNLLKRHAEDLCVLATNKKSTLRQNHTQKEEVSTGAAQVMQQIETKIRQ